MTRGFELRYSLPYLNGVYVAVSAIADARLVVDGPFCVVQKAELHHAHDPCSSLVCPTGVGRLVHSDFHLKGPTVHNALLDRGDLLVRLFSEVAALDDTGVVFLTSMDFHQVLAAPLERYRRAASAEGGAPLVLLESRSLDGDWLDGYAGVLARLAETLELPDPDPAPHRIALIGHLMDRAEGDQIGNLRELRRMLTAVGLDVTSVWLDGQGTAGLREVQRAGALVALPYGRAAARRLAERLDVPLVEADVPLGLGATSRLLRRIGDVTGRGAAVEAFLAAELRELLPRLRPLAFRYLAGRRALLTVDPFLALSLAEFLGELGVEVSGLTVCSSARQLSTGDAERLAALSAVFEPELGSRLGGGLCDDAEVDADVVLATTLFPHTPRRATWLPFGYPNFLRHPTASRPFLGFEGVRFLFDDLIEAVQRADLRRSLAPGREP